MVSREQLKKAMDKCETDKLDVYKQLASEIFGVKYSEVTSEQRCVAKDQSYVAMYSQEFTNEHESCSNNR